MLSHSLLLGSLLLRSAVSAQHPTPSPSDTTSRLLLKVGTGLTRGFFLGGNWGLAVPVVPGVEYRLRSDWTVYANGFCGVRLIGETHPTGEPARFGNLHALGFDAGVRRYYNQAKRRQQGRVAEPFVGNYLALQTASAWWRGRYTRTIGYEYSSLTVLWGMQRRLGKWVLFDGYAGLGLWNMAHERGTFYAVLDQDGPRTRSLQPVPELGVKLSLVR